MQTAVSKSSDHNKSHETPSSITQRDEGQTPIPKDYLSTYSASPLTESNGQGYIMTDDHMV